MWENFSRLFFFSYLKVLLIDLHIWVNFRVGLEQIDREIRAKIGPMKLSKNFRKKSVTINALPNFCLLISIILINQYHQIMLIQVFVKFFENSDDQKDLVIYIYLSIDLYLFIFNILFYIILYYFKFIFYFNYLFDFY